jgi:peptidoglycan/xylan/chitin deacetylase (PgdA/CDA1 family)
MRGGGVRILALEYHDIVTDDAWDTSGFQGRGAATYKVDATVFAQHLDAVRATGLPIVVDPIRPPERPSPTVIWTFDDGGSGFAAHAADLLEQRGWRGQVFMTTGWIGKPGFLTGPQLRDLQSRGHVIGTHSRTHPPRFAALRQDAMDEEWRSSIADLQHLLGHEVRSASVPGGSFSRSVAETAARNGIQTLFTSEPTTRRALVDGCTVVGRFTVRRGHRAAYVTALASRVPLTRGAQWCLWNSKKVAKLVAGGLYHRVRERVLGS